ncbi:MAG: hypothetical protein KAI66_17665 [Lentisphaeria bacterium]|nr:hypothetical protein [Lentisphaeria bacterium]
MSDGTAAILAGVGWVTQAGADSGTAALVGSQLLEWSEGGNETLASFNAKPYLSSVKGYLDPSSSFVLAASSLALADHGCAGGTRSGICTVTRFGATLSASRFHEQLVRKGSRFASPLIFPHGYANTAGNLAAIEFDFGGPHQVLYGRQDVREALDFALSRFQDGSADNMLVGAYESASGEVLPDSVAVMNGAVVAWLTLGSGGALSFTRDQLWEMDAPSQELGAVEAMLRVLRAL